MSKLALVERIKQVNLTREDVALGLLVGGFVVTAMGSADAVFARDEANHANAKHTYESVIEAKAYEASVHQYEDMALGGIAIMAVGAISGLGKGYEPLG